MSRRSPCGAARSLAALTLVSALLGACAATPDALVPAKGSTPRRTGNLTLRGALFSTQDFYFRPTRIDAEEGRLARPPAPGKRGEHELRFTRFSAKGTGNRYPIIYLAGGPGGSGILSAAGDRFDMFMRLREAGDVIALDARGAGHSRPRPLCPGTWSYPPDRPFDAATLVSIAGPYYARCAAHWRDSLDIDAFTTDDHADDIEALRIALGTEKVSLVGISYGTHLALAYLRRHPDRVHRMSLHGVEGPNSTWKRPSDVDTVLMRIDSAIKADPRARAAVPEFAIALREAIARLRNTPVTVRVQRFRATDSVDVTIGAGDLQRAVYYAISERERVALFPQRFAPVFRGDYRELAAFAQRTRPDNNDLLMVPGADCAAGVSAGRRDSVRAEAATAILGDAAFVDVEAECVRWPARRLGDDARMPVRSDVPVLIFSGSFDARTPPSNAAEAMRGLPNARHVILDGASHDDDLFLSTPRIVELMVGFLRGDDGVPPGTSHIALSPLRFKVR